MLFLRLYVRLFGGHCTAKDLVKKFGWIEGNSRNSMTLESLRLPEVIGRTRNGIRRRDAVYTGSAYTGDRIGGGTSKRKDIPNLHSIVNGPLTLGREESR